MCGSFRKPDLTYFPELQLSKEGVEVSQSRSTFVSNDFYEDAVMDQSAGFSLDRPSCKKESRPDSNLFGDEDDPDEKETLNKFTDWSTDIYSTGHVSICI